MRMPLEANLMEVSMKTRGQWLGVGLLLALMVALSACGAAPVVQGQSGSVTDERPNEDSALDQALLRDVDAAISAAKTGGQDVSAAQELRDSAVDLASNGHYAEANGNLKTAALTVGTLTGPGGQVVKQADKLPAAPAAQAQPRSAGNSVLSVAFADEAAISNWELVGPKSNNGTPLWESKDGVLRQRGLDGHDGSDDETGLVTGDATWANVTVSVDALGNGNPELGLIVRQQGQNFYRFRALAGNDTTTDNYVLEKVIDGTATTIGSFDGAALSLLQWHSLSLTANGTSLTAAVDGKTLGSVEDSSLQAGKVGVSTIATDGAYFANLQATRR